MDVSTTRRIVLLGKTGVGKSSLANTIFGESIFQINHFSDMKTHSSQAHTKSVEGRSITLIDTPGFFDLDRSEEEMKPEIVRCITECAPGPHAFLIVLKVEKFTEQEQAIITQMCEYFSEDALKYAIVVFTHGDQLAEGMKIEDYVDQSEGLRDLVEKCGGRCQIVDNKYWKDNQQDEYRSNKFQVAALLNTIDKIVMENNGGYFTNETLQEAESAIQKEEERIRKSAGNMSEEEIRKQAKSNVLKKQLDKAERTWRFVVLAVAAGVLGTVSALLIHSKYALTEAPLHQELIVPVMAAVVEPVAAAVEPVVKAVIEPVAAAVEPVVEAVIEPVAAAVEPVVEAVIEPVAAAVEPVVEAVVESAGTMSDILEERTFEAIMNQLEALYESIYDPWSQFE